ncbi:GntR family transcriptional regulator [Segetibacter koreensis]|uniref:GntR family transcriptional regulator n=1 Tax=Segetibacter koreensis TaxID=398037 RepID=UPI0003A5AA79|nr:GntR family transcriptional regulator [Segetibacter koreensis]
MNTSPFRKLIYFDEFSVTAKYQQLANSIIKAIENRKLQADDVLPSINELSIEFEISRDTAEKGYKYLKKLGIIGSVPGKGYFIKTSNVERKIKIFLLFNKLSAHKKIIYDALVSALGDAAAIDFYVYNNNFTFFKKLLQNCKEDYDYYVIIPHFLDGEENAHIVINTLPKEKLILLDKLIPGVTGDYGAIYENFEKDIYTALEEALPQLSKYHTINIILPHNTYYPVEIITGLNNFCQQYAFNSKVVPNIKKEEIKKGEVYINVMEDDLVTLVEKILSENLKIGEDVGVISYNETALKKIILNGITTISTDFQMMGEKTAELILTNSIEHIETKFYLTLRNSL